MHIHSFIRWWAQRLFPLGDIMNNPLANMHVQIFCTNTFPVPLGILTRNRIVWLYGNLCLAFWEIAGPFSKRAAPCTLHQESMMVQCSFQHVWLSYLLKEVLSHHCDLDFSINDTKHFLYTNILIIHVFSSIKCLLNHFFI